MLEERWEVTSSLYGNDGFPQPLPDFCAGCWKGCKYRKKGKTYNLLAIKDFCSLKINILGLETCRFNQLTEQPIVLGEFAPGGVALPPVILLPLMVIRDGNDAYHHCHCCGFMPGTGAGT